MDQSDQSNGIMKQHSEAANELVSLPSSLILIIIRSLQKQENLDEQSLQIAQANSASNNFLFPYSDVYAH